MIKEAALDAFEIDADSATPVVGEVRDKLLEPFIAAVRTALGEMAGTEVGVRGIYTKKPQASPGLLPGAKEMVEPNDIAGVLEFSGANNGTLVLSFPHRTAQAMAGRILADVMNDVDENLIRDCVGEIANVVAGQAKALLAGGEYQSSFSLPTVVVGAGALRTHPGLDCHEIAFESDQGCFTLQLHLSPSR